MDPISRLRTHLQSIKKNKVSLSELELIFQAHPCTDEQFAGAILELEADGVDDPLMFAVNPYSITNAVHRHLIVENKTTYQALLQVLTDVPFTTLIFGGGYRVTKSIELLPMQLPLRDPAHEFYYFGDIDKEGIHIWHLFNERVLALFGRPARLALPFYRACLSREFASGKENQRDFEQALQEFLIHFTEEEQIKINGCLAAGGYFPQEILPTHELCTIWRHTAWIT
ncbi:DUF2220 domain-containing protein [Paenibacillus andongensis]|uniref:DUF2220 domain-containing protein n=1 Tax=Paenibacillus andongensis TaxID=2975482 RepID=UPI0021BACA71|nr:DUF2220 domain-containing protein [Paenibacillus andongensis]